MEESEGVVVTAVLRAAPARRTATRLQLLQRRCVTAGICDSETLPLQMMHEMPKTFFITTAIYYTNSSPHVGHAYEMVLADVIARYHRLKGEKVFFLTGVDQHGQKVQQSAAKAGVASS